MVVDIVVLRGVFHLGRLDVFIVCDRGIILDRALSFDAGDNARGRTPDSLTWTFMWPFAVAGLGFRYLRMSFSVIYGHPRRKPRRTAFKSVEIFGFPNDWCANRTAFTRVRTEWVKAAIAVGIASWASLGIRALVDASGRVIGNVHRSVDMFLGPIKITFPLYCTSTRSLWNTTTHPALQSGRMPNRDAMAKSGITCPVSGFGSPGTTTSHVCVERTCRPSGRLTVRG